MMTALLHGHAIAVGATVGGYTILGFGWFLNRGNKRGPRRSNGQPLDTRR